MVWGWDGPMVWGWDGPMVWGWGGPAVRRREPSRAVVGLGVGRVWLHSVWVLSVPPPPSQQKHPDFPKKPLTPYFRFFMEKRAKYAKLHPEMSNLDLTKILSKKYKELPEKKKVRVGVGGGDGSSCLSSSPSTTGTARLLPGLGVTRRCFSPVGPVGPALLPRAAGWGWRWRLRPSVRPFQTALGGGVAVGWAVLGSPPRSGGAGRPCWRWDGRLGSVCRQQQKGRGAKSSVPLAHGRRLARAARGTGQEVGMPSCLPAWEGASGSSAGAAAL